jgi:dipeptidyl aminopeptidase/acylaminoacyl peptidase
MKKVFLLLNSALFFYGCAISQKRLIDIRGENWATHGIFLISNDGSYTACAIDKPVGDELLLSATQSEWRMRIAGAMLMALTQDSRKVIYKQGDSVCILDLHEPTSIQFIKHVGAFRVIKQGRDNDVLLYTLTDRADQLVIRKVESGSEHSYLAVENYWPSDDGKVVVLETVEKDSGLQKYVLNYLDLEKNSFRTIWRGKSVDEVKIGHSDLQFAFAVGSGIDTAGVSVKDLWLYDNAVGKSRKIVDGRGQLTKGLIISGVIAFNDVSDLVFVDLNEVDPNRKTRSKLVSVDIWSYKDPALRVGQPVTPNEQRKWKANYKGVVNTINGEICRIEFEDERVLSQLLTNKSIKYILLNKNEGGEATEWYWNNKSFESIYLIDLENGRRRLLSKDIAPNLINSYQLSYNEQYVYYYEPHDANYYAYRISDGLRSNMTGGIRRAWVDGNRVDVPGNSYCPYSVAGLVKQTDAILVYDQNGIVRLDATGQTMAEDLVKFPDSLRREYVFRLATGSLPLVLEKDEVVCLNVFNKRTKDACLIGARVDRPLSNMRMMDFRPYRFNETVPVKARDKDAYIVERMSAQEAPNLFLTTDFKKYNAITDIHPESSYNWMETELITWKAFNGGVTQGILFKPQDFDPRKKYPLLIYYYERLSDDLHNFMYPQLSDGTLNIPYYVSHGYLVFEPDIHFTLGRPGQSVYDCVVSGVQVLAKRSYVNTRRMGLQGHSFGGYETNYLVTHSTLFAAAMSASGVSDFVSGYSGSMGSRQFLYERGQNRMGGSLWEKPQAYIANSPIFLANRVSTPLLINANKKDGVVPYDQGIELFTALRRLGKKVWMLQYDGEDHSLIGKSAKEDFTIRMAQFFNYYLKDEAPPRWMTVGVSADDKGIDSGLEIDSSGRTP